MHQTSSSHMPCPSIPHLEEYYQAEQQLIRAVSLGQSHHAEQIFARLCNSQHQLHTINSLNSPQSFLIAFHTMLRLAATSGAVHPLHINELHTHYNEKINLVITKKDGLTLVREMIHRYCLLVKNHSLKGYSSLIQKLLTNIDYDITADLSLKAQAELLNVNSSYLSTLFKKEYGITLTEYVNNKRIGHAIFLLNSTDMQIQMIAQHCGIPDVNYFTKMFKKIIGMTPKEYRKSLFETNNI